MSMLRALWRTGASHHGSRLLRSTAQEPSLSNVIRAFHTGYICREAPAISSAHTAKHERKQELSKITPKYQITFTCKACDHRSTHQMSHKAYHEGTVLIQCPSCKNRHLIADNLNWFSDTKTNIEDILRDQGQSVQKGQLSEGDLEFMPDGNTELKSNSSK